MKGSKETLDALANPPELVFFKTEGRIGAKPTTRTLPPPPPPSPVSFTTVPFPFLAPSFVLLEPVKLANSPAGKMIEGGHLVPETWPWGALFLEAPEGFFVLRWSFDCNETNRYMYRFRRDDGVMPMTTGQSVIHQTLVNIPKEV